MAQEDESDVRSRAKVNLEAIHRAMARGSMGPFAEVVADERDKGSKASALEIMKNNADQHMNKREQEEELRKAGVL